MDNINFADVADRIYKIYRSANEVERQCLKKILEEIATLGYSETYNDVWLSDYKEIPVDIGTFLSSEAYLGNATRNGEAIYPYWWTVFHDIFDNGNKYEECVFTGATRIGKTSTAINCVAYMLYWLMCLRDPQEYFRKKDVSKFSILFFNITKDLAAGVAYREFNDTLRTSPWFCQHGTFSRSEQNFYYIPEGDKITIDFGSDASHGLGKQVFVAVLDEVNFSKAGVKDVNKAKKSIMDTYNTISARIKGTFRMHGEVYGKLFAVSSKNSDSDFIEEHVQKQLSSGAGEHLYVSDKPQWEVLPPSMFKDEKFYIAVGDRYKRGFVIPDNQTDEDALEDLRKQGYLILTPPIDMRPEFIADFDIALRDLAGKSVPGALSFISQQIVDNNIDTKRRCPFYQDIYQMGTMDSSIIEEFFHIEHIQNWLRYPAFIHIDLSKNTDRTGISGVAVTGRKDITTGDGKTISQPEFTHLFSVAIEATRGDRIPYAKITAFICWLRLKGMNIFNISRDQFQSEYMAQLLEAQGFTVDNVSLDRTPDAYTGMKSILLEQRVNMLDHKLLQDELIHLQRDTATGKIDHPVFGCFTGDTKIRLVDGRSLTIEELLLEQQYKTNWVYTVNLQNKCIEPKRIKRVFQTKWVTDIVEVALDNGEKIRCTPNHLFMLRDGTYEEAQNLKCNDSLMPLYTEISDKGLKGYRRLYQPFEDRWVYEHRAFCLNNLHIKGFVIHHCNYNKLDNSPSNLKYMSKSEHQRIYNNSTMDYRKSSESLKQRLRERKSDVTVRNHKVVSVNLIHNPCRVYDLTIEDNPNFALDAGVFVHNSKDVADSFAGALWNATLKNPGITIPVKSTANIIASINGKRNTGSMNHNPKNNKGRFPIM